MRFVLFFFNDTATTEIYTLSLHDALPIYRPVALEPNDQPRPRGTRLSRRSIRQSRKARFFVPAAVAWRFAADRKSTRLNSSHLVISYAVFCLKKKKPHIKPPQLYSCTSVS